MDVTEALRQTRVWGEHGRKVVGLTVANALSAEVERLRTLCELGIGREQLALSQEIVRLRAVIAAYSDITSAYRLGLQPKGQSIDVVSEYWKNRLEGK